MSVLIWLILLSGLQQRGPLPANALAGPRGTIEGTVFRAGAAPGAPTQYLSNASVELRGAGLRAITDPAGRFAIANVPPGRYTLDAVREGYVIQEDALQGITSAGMAITVAAGQTLKDVALPMIAAPVIAGHV